MIEKHSVPSVGQTSFCGRLESRLGNVYATAEKI